MFDVITNGFGAMPDYKAQIDARDRWRIVAYMKALQLAPGAGAAGATDSAPTPAPAGRQRRRSLAPATPTSDSQAREARLVGSRVGVPPKAAWSW